jgi:hypothetical protein
MRDPVSWRWLADVAHSRVWSRLHGRVTLVRPAALGRVHPHARRM